MIHIVEQESLKSLADTSEGKPQSGQQRWLRAHTSFHFIDIISSLAIVTTAVQTTELFEDADQMVLSNRTWVYSLQVEEILTISDLSDW